MDNITHNEDGSLSWRLTERVKVLFFTIKAVSHSTVHLHKDLLEIEQITLPEKTMGKIKF